jgi:hypothetical protein
MNRAAQLPAVLCAVVACALVGLALARIAGSAKGEIGPPEVRCDSAVNQIELVEPDVSGLSFRLGQADLGRRGGQIALQRPGSLLSSPPDGRRVFVARGRDHLAIIGGEPKSLDQDENADSRGGEPKQGIDAAGQPVWWSRWRPCARDTIWLADTDGRPVGKADLRSLEPQVKILNAAAVWDDPGRRLAAWVSTEARTYVGLVDLELFTFRPVAVVDDVGRGALAVPTLLWRNGDLVLYYEARDGRHEAENVVLRIEPSTGEVREVLREERWDPSRRPLHALSLSPDGRYLAFDRAFSAKLIEAGGTCAGIWVLDLESGECVELTYEDTTRYQHKLVQWDDADTLLFTCRVQGPPRTYDGIRDDLYRARLDLPLREDPTRIPIATRGREYSLTRTDGPRALARPPNAGSESQSGGRASATGTE